MKPLKNTLDALMRGLSDKKEGLARIVGTDNVVDEPGILSDYAKDQSFAPPRKPRLVVKPENADEVQKIVAWANQTGTPLVPVSSGGPHFHGDTVPGVSGATIIDLSRMKRIIRIDRRNRMVMIEPGVTFGQLQPELAKEGLKLSMPLLPRSNKSVLTSALEREPTMVPKYQWQLLEPLRCIEVVWGDGNLLKTGEASTYGSSLEMQWKLGQAQVDPFGPAQVDYYRLVSAAQGSMGIVTWASIKCEILPQTHKLFFIPSEKLDNLLGFAYRLLRFRYGDEFLFLNGSNLAYILGEGADQIRALKEELPPWVLILGLAGRDQLPEERVEFQERDLSDIAQQFGLQTVSAMHGARDGQVLQALNRPSKEPYWKLQYKGGCQDIFFLTTLNRAPEFVETMYALAEQRGYPPAEIGTYVQPVQQGAGCHCEFNLPFDPSNPREVAKIQRLFTECSEALVNQGAYFSRPYGIWAGMAYNKDQQTASLLKKLKGIFDPQNVMNPGKLCFQVQKERGI